MSDAVTTTTKRIAKLGAWGVVKSIARPVSASLKSIGSRIGHGFSKRYRGVARDVPVEYVMRIYPRSDSLDPFTYRYERAFVGIYWHRSFDELRAEYRPWRRISERIVERPFETDYGMIKVDRVELIETIRKDKPYDREHFLLKHLFQTDEPVELGDIETTTW
jgi:hypothetical protein